MSDDGLKMAVVETWPGELYILDPRGACVIPFPVFDKARTPVGRVMPYMTSTRGRIPEPFVVVASRKTLQETKKQGRQNWVLTLDPEARAGNCGL